jgi:chromosome segregation ATPase
MTKQEKKALAEALLKRKAQKGRTISPEKRAAILGAYLGGATMGDTEPGAPHDLLKQVEQARRDLSAATARIAELERALTGREARYVQAQEDRNAANDRAEAAESTCKALRNELSRDMTASGEAEAVSLRAEVDRLRDERDEAEEHKRQADTSKLEERKLRIKADRSLAAATALLRQVHADQAPTVSLLCAIGDHLDDQAPTRREAERG